MERCVPAEALVIVLLAASTKILAFAMLRGYTDSDDGVPTAAASLACNYQPTVRGLSMPLGPSAVVPSPNNAVWC